MADTIDGTDIQSMISHFLATPVEGYLGSPYGNDIKSLLMLPLNDPRVADRFLKKLRSDVPVLNALPSGTVNLYATPADADRLNIVLEVAGRAYNLTELARTRSSAN